MSNLTGFERFLLTIDKQTAIDHMIDCLKYGAQGNNAWTLMEHYEGPNWSCKPEQLPFLVNRVLNRLREEVESD